MRRDGANAGGDLTRVAPRPFVLRRCRDGRQAQGEMSVNETSVRDAVRVDGVAVWAANASQLAELRDHRIDHGGNPVEIFADVEGGWPLRCCLRDSTAGDRLAIVAWAPFPWCGPYAE